MRVNLSSWFEVKMMKANLLSELIAPPTLLLQANPPVA